MRTYNFLGTLHEEIVIETSCFTEAQIIGVLREAKGGLPVAEICREHGISIATFDKWRSKYGGMDASMISQIKELEDENRRLKLMYADLSMQAYLLKESLGKKDSMAISTPGDGRDSSGASRCQHRIGLPGLWCD